MKRTERVGAMIKTLTDTPSKLYSLQYFCEAFGAAKSSISEDINLADASVRATGTGFIETISGARGGVRFVPDINEAQLIVYAYLRQQPDFGRRFFIYIGHYV